MNKKSIFLIILFLFTLVIYYYYTEPTVTSRTVEVGRVIDGDTFETVNEERVRIKGINTPEKGMPYYMEAKEFLKFLIENKTVAIESSELDKYSRTLAHLNLKNKNIEEEMLRQGLATLYYYEKDDYYSRLKDAEKYARESEIGLWEKSKDYGCLKLIKLDYKEEGKRCNNKESLVIQNLCSFDIGVTLKDDARHIYQEVILANSLFTKQFSCVFNDDGDSLYVWDEKGLLMFYRY